MHLTRSSKLFEGTVPDPAAQRPASFVPVSPQQKGRRWCLPRMKDIRIRIRLVVERVSRPRLEVLDQIFGLRSWGLILYGALPASLSLVGLLEVKVEEVNLRNISMAIPILLISLLPLLVTFLLVRAREKEWYFTEDYLNFRSCITTLIIVLCATTISGGAGIIKGQHVSLGFAAQSFLFGMASLVLSSTLFAAILAKDADLPGLPSSGFVSSIGKARQKLIAIQISSIWERYDFSDGTQIFDDLVVIANNLRKELGVALSEPGNRLAKRSLKPLDLDVGIFAQSVSEIKAGQSEYLTAIRWKVRFADFAKLQDNNLANLKNSREGILDEYSALQRLKSLRLGG